MRHRNIARTGVLNLLAQILLLAVLYLTAHEHPLAAGQVWRTLILTSLVLGQSALWTAFFYLQDRGEPEPTRYVLLAFLAGMAAATLAVLPADHAIFRSAAWMYRSPATLVVGAACVKGALAALAVFAIVRYGFMGDAEFDEPADGLAYGAFIGCGLAAALSLSDLSARADFTLFAMAAAAATNVLVYGSVGGLVGYLVGRTKFSSRPGAASQALAIFVGAALIEIYQIVEDFAMTSGASQPLWAGASAAAAFAVLVLGTATVLMFRVTSKAATDAGPYPPSSGGLALLVAAVLLAVGGYASYTNTKHVTFQDARYPISFAYDPVATMTQTSFSAHGSPGMPMVFTARTTNGANIVVQTEAGAPAPDQADTTRYLLTADPVDLTTTDVTIGGQRGLRLRYAYLARAAHGPRDLPRLRWAYTDVVTAGGRTYAMSFDAPPEAFGRDEPVYAALLSTVRWSQQ